LLLVFGFFLYFLGAVVELGAATTITEVRAIGRVVHHSAQGVEEVAGKFWHGGLRIRANK